MKAVRLSILAFSGLLACGHSRPKVTRYILPDGTAGWVKIAYNRSDSPELPIENGAAVVRIPGNMKVATRTAMTSDWNAAEFYYQKSNGQLERLATQGEQQRRLWAMEKTSTSDGDQESFFVGKPDQFTKVYKTGNDMNTSLADKPVPSPLDSTDPSERLKIETELPK
ncbi:MAG TPA: hypothetical protein VGL72_32470 [Bryobacteraceae bacterium]